MTNDIYRILKIDIKRLQVNASYRQVFVISDVSQIISSQKSKLKHNFSKQLTSSLCHETMTPLNCIINVSEILKTNNLALVNKTTTDKFSSEQAITWAMRNMEMIDTVLSSAKFTSHMLNS